MSVNTEEMMALIEIYRVSGFTDWLNKLILTDVPKMVEELTALRSATERFEQIEILMYRLMFQENTEQTYAILEDEAKNLLRMGQDDDDDDDDEEESDDNE